MQTYKALIISESSSQEYIKSIVTRPLSELKAHDVLIKVVYTGLNYKDALSASGNKGVTRQYPHTPGIDAAGVVETSKNVNFKKGDEVIVTSYDLGMNTFGGFSEYISVPASWVITKPKELSFRESMIIGTAGLTAAIGIEKLIRIGQNPESGPVVVSGATGGVGSIALILLQKLGFQVFAATGKRNSYDYLKQLGANKIFPRKDIDDQSKRPLLKQKWAGAIDTVGGNVLNTLIKCCQKEGSIATCGNVGGHILETTVFPFILNGVNLLGIDSATYPMSLRKLLWKKLATKWKPSNLDLIAIDTDLDNCLEYFDKILKSEIRGRIVVKI